MASSEIETFIHASIVFIVYLFIMVSIFFFLSGPIDSILTSIESNPPELAEDEMQRFSPDINSAIWMVFAIGIATPITWIVFWVFSREPFISIRRR